jgi:hypothetical protein
MGASRQKPPRPSPTLRLQPIGTQGKSRISAIASGKIPKRRIGKKPRRDERVALEVQAPEVRWHLLEFQAQFPAAPALVSTPHQDGVANVLVRQIDQPQFLPYCKSLREDRQAPFRADVHGITFGPVAPAVFSPLYGHCHSRIQADSRADMLHPLLEVTDDRRHILLGLAAQAGCLRAYFDAKPHPRTSLAVHIGYGASVLGSMELTSCASEK